jgi:fatty-acyl-CoA synthase
VVVLRPDFEGNDKLASELMALVKDAKGSVHTPKSIDFVAGIPLTNVGKPDKKVLRAQYWKDSDRAV